MEPCRMPVQSLLKVLVIITLAHCSKISEDAAATDGTHLQDVTKLNRHRRQLIFRTFNNTADGNNLLLGSASLSVETFLSAEDLYPWLLRQALYNQTAVDKQTGETAAATTTTTTTTTTTQAPTTTTSGGRDLSQACTCVGGRCVTFQEIFDLCLSTVRSSTTCLANLDLLCDNVKSQAAG